jgi:hypothetical protein
MFWRRRGNTRGGCIIVPIPCGCVASPLVLLSGFALLYACNGIKGRLIALMVYYLAFVCTYAGIPVSENQAL